MATLAGKSLSQIPYQNLQSQFKASHCRQGRIDRPPPLLSGGCESNEVPPSLLETKQTHINNLGHSVLKAQSPVSHIQLSYWGAQLQKVTELPASTPATAPRAGRL